MGNLSRKSVCKLFNYNLRKQLIVLVLSVWMPFLALSLINALYRYQDDVQVQYETQKALAGGVEAALLSRLQTLWDTELAIGMTLTSGLPVEEIDSFVSSQLDHGEEIFDQLLWADARGEILNSTDKSAVGRSVWGTDYFQRIVAGEDRVVSEMQVTSEHGQSEILVARAIRRQGQLLGAVLARVQVDWVTDNFADHWQDMIFGVVDARGQGFYWNASGPLSLVDRAMSPRRKFDAEDGVVYDIGGVKHIGSLEPIEKLGWKAYVLEPEGQALLTARFQVSMDIVFMLLTAVVSLVFADQLGSLISVRIKKLETAAKLISQGDFSTKVDIAGEDEVAISGRAFNHMVARIDELESERQRFLQIAAHELRNPMAAIKGVLQTIDRKGAKMSPGGFHSLVALVQREVDRLALLLNEILETFKDKTNELRIEVREINLSDLLERVMAPLTLGPHGSRFSFRQNSRGSVLVLGDLERLEQVFTNLIGNAVKYSGADSPIWVSLDTDSQRAVVAIKDFGQGISAQQLPHIFKPFYRTEESNAMDPHGLGLGLYICQNIVERHGGKIWAESEAGQGTTFFVELALARVACEDNPASVQAS